MAKGNRLAARIARTRDDILAGWEADVRTLAGGALPALVSRVPAPLGSR